MIWYMTYLKQNKKKEKTRRKKHNIKFKLFNLVYTLSLYNMCVYIQQIYIYLNIFQEVEDEEEVEMKAKPTRCRRWNVFKRKKIPSIKKEKQKQMQKQKQSKPIISKRRGRNKHKQKENKT